MANDPFDVQENQEFWSSVFKVEELAQRLKEDEALVISTKDPKTGASQKFQAVRLKSMRKKVS